MFEFHEIKSNFEFCTMALFEFFPALSLQNTLQNTDSNSISVYSECLLKYTPIHDKQHKVCI